MRRRIVASAIAAVCLALATACTAAPGLTLDPATTTVEYSFRDSSVPPRYHRSYVITATEKEASITVDSYGDVLRQENAAMPAETWADVMELAATLPSRAGKISDPEPGCAGGTASKVIVKEGDHERYSKSAEKCGGASDEPLTDTAAPLVALFDMNELLKTDP
ncbi:hypothetical protein AB0N65_00195 [Paenarthrobacter sp. NPDC089322]|uniref:hypothetical protein n=1 Tax=Paenarthrobacter sp. NPDC089322 TaxID=3155065 RepID=UPI003424BA81